MWISVHLNGTVIGRAKFGDTFCFHLFVNPKVFNLYQLWWMQAIASAKTIFINRFHCVRIYLKPISPWAGDPHCCRSNQSQSINLPIQTRIDSSERNECKAASSSLTEQRHIEGDYESHGMSEVHISSNKGCLYIFLFVASTWFSLTSRNESMRTGMRYMPYHDNIAHPRPPY